MQKIIDNTSSIFQIISIFKIKFMQITDDLQKIKQSLQKKNLCILPTDTILGIFSSTDDHSVEKIFYAKKRSHNKPLAIFLPNIQTISQYGILNDNAQVFIQQNLPGAFTILLKATDWAKNMLPRFLISQDDKIGIRIPNQHDILNITKEIIICGTSVNVSGQNFADYDNIPHEIQQHVEYLYKPNCVKLSHNPSQIVDFSTNEGIIVR